MIIQVNFNENSQSFKAAFGETVKLPDESYNNGYDDGYDEAANYFFDAGYAAGEAEGYKDGKQAQYEEFWNIYIPDNLSNWQYVFYSPRWNDSNFYPNKDLNPKGAAPFAFSSHEITNLKQRLIDCGVRLDTSNITSGNYMFCYCSKLTHLPTISFVGLKENISNAFNNDTKLVEIEKIILKDDGSTTFSYWFDKCAALTTISFEGVIGNNINFQWSTKLTKASIESIINHLSDTTTGKTLTLSKAAADEAFPCWMDGVNYGAGGNGEWLFLKESKPNWTIKLV